MKRLDETVLSLMHLKFETYSSIMVVWIRVSETHLLLQVVKQLKLEFLVLSLLKTYLSTL